MKIIEKSLEEKKADWKATVKRSWKSDLAAGFKCSNGIVMDADWDAILKFKTGIEYLNSISATSIDVRDHINAVHTLTLADAETMLNELIANYYSLIKKKWEKQTEIEKLNKKIMW